jgi:hypothetical protein
MDLDMVVGQFLTPSMNEAITTRPIFSSVVSVLGGITIASYLYRSCRNQGEIEFSIKRIRDKVDEKLFYTWEKILDTCFVSPLKRFLPLRKESEFCTDSSLALERETHAAFAKKGFCLNEILARGREVFDLKEEVKISLENTHSAATSSGVCPKKITLNLRFIENKEDALFFLGHELGHSIEEDVLKSHITSFLLHTVSIYKIFQVLALSEIEKSAVLFEMVKHLSPLVLFFYLRDVQMRHVEFRADRYGLFLLQACQKLKDFLRGHERKITPKEALDLALSWPNPPGLRESMHYRHEEGTKMCENGTP